MKGGLRPAESLDDIARRCFEVEEKEKPIRGENVALFMVLVAVGAYVATLSPGVAAPVLLGLILLAALILPGTGIVLGRWRVSRALSAFHAGDPGAVRRVHDFAVREFRQQVEQHRARTLGTSSEWGAARSSLAEAAHEAQRSVAYWEARVQQEPENELATGQSRTAAGLEEKLHRALAKLDKQAETLLKFYNDCDAKLALMDRYSRDMEETRRLEELSGRTDIAIAGAEDTLLTIGAQFVREAQAVGRALGGLSRVQIKSLAGDAPLDNIEYLADRIIESSDAERQAVEDLDRVLREAQ